MLQPIISPLKWLLFSYSKSMFSVSVITKWGKNLVVGCKFHLNDKHLLIANWKFQKSFKSDYYKWIRPPHITKENLFSWGSCEGVVVSKYILPLPGPICFVKIPRGLPFIEKSVWPEAQSEGGIHYQGRLQNFLHVDKWEKAGTEMCGLG